MKIYQARKCDICGRRSWGGVYFMPPANGITFMCFCVAESEWKVGNNGSGKRIWFVYRNKPSGMQVHSASNGRYIRYAGISGALRIANRLNSEAMTPIAVDAGRAPVAD